MTPSRWLKWTAGIVLAPVLLSVLFVAIFGWNWLRGPVERITAQKTGRVLAIKGDLTVALGWPWPHVRAGEVTFANPAWATEKQMLSADAVAVTLDLPQLLQRSIVFPEVRLERPVIYLELGSGGRKSWLLDLDQQDENAQIRVDRLTLDHGTLGFDDSANQTHIRSDISTLGSQGGTTNSAALAFSAQGTYKGLSLKATGTGGPVLAMRDESTPYPLKVDATIDHTRVQADGSVTSLLKFTAIDMRLALQGENLAQLYPVLGIAFPATRAYTTEGHLLHNGSDWRYEKFSGRVGASDIAGSAQVDVSAKRAIMNAELNSNLLDLDDLGPMIGARPGSVQAAKKAAPVPAQTNTPTGARALPDLPFNSEHWNSVDAEVSLRARTLRRAKALPLENFMAHLSLRDSVLTLDPLSFGLAGGQLSAVIALDGRKEPIQAHAKIKVRKVQLAKLFPTVALSQASVGQLNGEFDLSGHGDSVGRMLATANGQAGMVVVGGEVSKLMMEKAGLHLWEILQLSVTGDRQVKLRCAVADFEITNGKAQADALIFDTQVTTLIGTGSIDLAQERLDLTLNQKTKDTSPLALRSPIYIRGSFAKPEVGVDKGRVAVRALGAIALGVVTPLLAMLPLIDAGPGKDSDCGQLVHDAKVKK
jgi:AsmA protein